MNVADVAGNRILLDVMNWALVALGLALPIYALLRRRFPGKGWGAGGHPAGRDCDALDLVVAVGFVLLWRFTLGHMTGGGSSGAGGSAGEALDLKDVIAGALFQLALGSFLTFYLHTLRMRSLVAWTGIRRHPPALVLGWALVFLVPAFFALYAVQDWSSHHLLDPAGLEDTPQPAVESFIHAPMVLRLALAITAVGIAPVMEEFLFRGFIQQAVKKFTDVPFAVIFSGLVFALAHQHLGSLLPLGLLGMTLAAAYEITGSLAVVVLMHALFNLASLGLLTLGGQ